MLRKIAKDTFRRNRKVVGEGTSMMRLMASSSRKKNRLHAQRGHSQRLRNAVASSGQKKSTVVEQPGPLTALTFLGVVPLVGMGLLIGLNDGMKEEFLKDFGFWQGGNDNDANEKQAE